MTGGFVGYQDHLPNTRYLGRLYGPCSGKEGVREYVDRYRLPLVCRVCVGWDVPISAVSICARGRKAYRRIISP